MTVYYNEFDPQVAAWLRVLIADGHIAPGVVDERSIEDVRPSDLRGFTQCHFFAGIGVWSYALRRAGWRDDRPIWTGSCPCQPFSAAGKGAGFDDERHLWPAFQWLIQECKPAIVLGEQVASAAVDDWIDLVHADMEAMGHAFGSIPFPAAGVGAPHIRDRNYWVAHALPAGRAARRAGAGVGSIAGRGSSDGLDDSNSARLAGYGLRAENGSKYRIRSEAGSAGSPGPGGRLADMQGNGCEGQSLRASGGLQEIGASDIGGIGRLADASHGSGQRGESWATVGGLPAVTEENAALRPGPTNGFWRAADWLGCRDGKFRPVEPGTFPLADGAAARVGRLRGYGNAVNAEQARAWIETVMECLPC